MIRTSQRCRSCSACVEAAAGNQLISKPEGDADDRRDHAEDDHLDDAPAPVRRIVRSRALLAPWRRDPMAWDATDGDIAAERPRASAVDGRRRGVRPRRECRRRPPARPHEAGRGAVAPRARRRGGAGTPWRTAPAGGSRRAGRPRARSAPRGEQLGRALHAHGREVLAERRVADLGVGALELAARGRDAAGDVVERRGRLRTRPRRSRRRPRRGSCGGGRWRIAAITGSYVRRIAAMDAGPGAIGCQRWRVDARHGMAPGARC